MSGIHHMIANVAIRPAKPESTADGAPQLEAHPIIVNPEFAARPRVQPHTAFAANIVHQDKPSYIRTESTPEAPQQ